MKDHTICKEIIQCLVIAEFAEKRLGLIVGVYDNEAKAKSLVNHPADLLNVYSLNSQEEIPAFYFDNYQSYRNSESDQMLWYRYDLKYIVAQIGCFFLNTALADSLVH